MNPSVFTLDTSLDEALEAAATAISQGQCVVLPTDTVYGIGANAFDADAVQALLDAKQRGRDMPPPVLLAEPLMMRAVADDVPDEALALARTFWPGALTLILKAQPRGGMHLGETGGTIAVRVPDHDVARALLRMTGPLAVSSANVSGRPAALTADEAQAQLGEAAAVYLDAGAAPGGVASTIVDFAADAQGRVVRLGAISLERIREVAPGVMPLPEADDDQFSGDESSDETAPALPQPTEV